MAGAALDEQIAEVPEELEVTALVRRDGDGLGVLLDGGVDDLVRGAVVAEVDHLGAGRLQHPPEDVDRRVVAVEQRRGRDEPHLVHRRVAHLAPRSSVRRRPRR